jgi:upstream activation factor subunit UAF30
MAKKKTTVKKKVKVAAKKTVARKKAPAKKAVKKASAPRKKAGLNLITYTLSPELQAIVGSKKLTRPQVVKQLWVYIKAHKCQDTKNRRMINPDKKLSEVLGSRPIDMLKIAGMLSKHIE